MSSLAIYAGGQLTAVSLAVSGTAGAGNVALVSQSAVPSTPVSGVTVYSGGTGNLSFVSADGKTRTYVDANTANRTYTFPDLSDTLTTINSVATLTGKTIDTNSNTINLAGNSITNLLGQDVRSSASPSFNTVAITGAYYLVSATAPNPRFEVGSGTTSRSVFGQATGAGSFFAGALDGDTIIRNGTATNYVLLGVGTTGLAQVSIGQTAVTITQPVLMTNLTADNTQTNVLTLSSTGAVAKRTLASFSIPVESSGTFTSTIGNQGFTTVPASVTILYQRVNNMVYCSSSFQVTPVSGNGNGLSMTLPITRATNFSNVNQSVGVVTSNNNGSTGSVQPYSGMNNSVIVALNSPTTATITINVVFMYILV